MKRGTPDHPKTKELAEALAMPLPYVVGTLEMLWHWTAKFTPRGDIGKYSDKTIEDALYWTGTQGALIAVLTDKKWLDRDPEHRLIVHDWHEHADESVRKGLKRNGQEFVRPKSGQCPDNFPTESGKIPPALPSHALPSHALPSHALPVPPSDTSPPDAAPRRSRSTTAIADEPKPESADPAFVARQLARDLHATHPALSSRGYAESAAETEIAKAKPPDPERWAESIKATHAAHCNIWREAKAQRPNAFIPQLHIWFRDGYYLQKNICAEPRGSPRNGSKTAALEAFIAERKKGAK